MLPIHLMDTKKAITLLIGNGLCLAFQGKNQGAEFKLRNILKKLQKDNTSSLWNEQKDILMKILRKQSSLESENDIGELNEIIQAFHVLNKVNFPVEESFDFQISEVIDSYNSLVEKVLQQICESSELILDQFKEWFDSSMQSILEQGPVNIATLNYDHLLHTSLFRHKKFRDTYTDGFPTSSRPLTFSRSSFEKLTHSDSKADEIRRGFFHLHGSYLIR